MADQKLRILVIGAHPDDCDFKAGGTAALYRQAGHHVQFVSSTNGDAGHHRISGEPLAAIRRAEAKAAGEVVGLQYDVLDFPDGQLEPTYQNRLKVIRLIRESHPDLILTHRPNDYHPDHRYTSQLVCDAAYMVTVPAVLPEVPALRDNPVIGYLSDSFERPYPFSPTVVVDIEPVLETVIDMLDCHKSQVYEWLPYSFKLELAVPEAPDQRREMLRTWYLDRIADLADKHRDLLIQTYGEERGRKIRYIEAFEPCEYGTPLSDSQRQRLFPFLSESKPV